ncbi:hypothetical protein SAMN05216486_1045 [bacterium JGI 053]|nr:hypothetical protein SAMN05216486_1045 [bacterium JGI 053]
MTDERRDSKGKRGIVSAPPADGAHPGVLDRHYAEETSETVYGKSLDLIKELIDEGTNLQVRALVSSPREIPDVVLLGVLYRRSLQLLDSIEILLRSGQGYGARIMLRALLEASWGIEWMLKADTERRAKQFYVIDIRERIELNESFVPGTKAFASMKLDVPIEQQRELGIDEEAEAISRANIKKNREHLEEYPDLNLIDGEVSRQKKRVGLLRWFTLFGGPQDYADLARKLGHADEYRLVYRSLNDAVHGSNVQSHVSIETRGVAVIPTIRGLEEFGDVLEFTWIAGFRITQLMIEHYRPGEMRSFLLRFFPRGKARWNPPNVEFHREVNML